MNSAIRKSSEPWTGEEWTPVSVSFGSITIKTLQPPESIRRANILAGQTALQRAKKALATPGIRLRRQKGVPLFFGCEDNPGLMVRELDGKRTLGKFVNGRFRAVKQYRG